LRRHGSATFRQDEDSNSNNTPNGAGAAENADMEFKTKAGTNVAGAPVPTPREREYFWNSFPRNNKLVDYLFVQCSETHLVETAA
tara:strand:+ start:418 stop:672 length:255 start_codon:yes stop_codon:yes gene_type:complete